MSALGKNSLWPMIFYRESTRHLLGQMAQAGVARLVCLTSVGVLDKPVGPRLYVWLIKPLLKNIYADMRRMEQLLRASDLAWTVVRPSRLFDGPRRGRYRVGVSGELPQTNAISRADLANCMLNEIESRAHWRQVIAVVY